MSTSKKYYYEDLLNELILNLKLSNIYNVYFREEVYLRNYPHFNVVLVDTLRSLSFLYRKLFEIGSSNLAHTLIYVAELKDPHYEGFERFFGVLFNMSILNVGIIVQLPTAEIVMITYYPFEDAGCHDTNPVIFNRYVSLQQGWHSDVFFPEKVSSFNGCTLTCATWESMPFMTIKYDDAGLVSAYTGIEGEFLEFLKDRLNMSIGLYMLSERQVTETNNQTGQIFREIFQKADYAIGGFYYRNGLDPYLAPFSQSTSYFMSTIYIVTNALSEHYMYEQLVLPFDSVVWTMTGLCVFIGSLLIYITGTHHIIRTFIIGRRNRLPYFYMYSVLMGVTITPSLLPQRNFARFLIIIWMLGTLVLRSAYQSAMFQIYRNNLHYDPPQTVADVFAQKYLIETTEEYYHLLEPVPDFHRHVRVHNLSAFAAFEQIVRNPKGRRAVIVGHEFYGYFRQQHRVAAAGLHLVPEAIFTQQMSIYVRPNSFLNSVLNEQIQLAQTYGFNTKWRTKFASDVGEQHREYSAEQNGEIHALMVLNLSHLQGIFMVVLWMLLITIFIFGIEMIAGRQNWRRFRSIFSI